MKPPEGTKITFGESDGRTVTAHVTYCPCAGECHRSPSPCSFGCIIHDAEFVPARPTPRQEGGT
jgi:hypothetical protein